MKNTFLKKVGAVALAAVMAVTFAPVASLNVLADTNVSEGDVILNQEEATITGSSLTSKTYTVINTTSPTTIYIDGNGDLAGTKTNPKTYTFDITKANQKVTFVITGPAAEVTTAAIKIQGTAYPAAGKVYIPTVALQTNDWNYSGFNVSLSGDLRIDDEDINKSPKLKSAIGTQPFATVGEDYFLNNAAINAWQQVNPAPLTVTAYNGNVKVDGLKAGNAAVVAEDVYTNGTSIDATAAAKTALATVKTTLNYTTQFYDENTKAYSVKIGRHYTENAFYAGYSRIKDGVLNSAVPCAGYAYVSTGTAYTVTTGAVVAGTNKVVTNEGLHVGEWLPSGYVLTTNRPVKLVKPSSKEVIYGLYTVTDDLNKTGFKNYAEWAKDGAKYKQAITIAQNGEDWTDKEIDNYVSDDDDSRNNGNIDGITYYTMDPTSFTKSEDGIALVDGTMYVVSGFDSSKRELRWVASDSYHDGFGAATKSVKIMRGTEIDPTAGDDLAYETFSTEKALDVTAPADMSVIKATQDNVTGRYKYTGYEWRVFGDLRNSSQGDEDQVYYFPYKARNEFGINKNIYVAQVASGSTMEVYADPRVGVSKADNLGYFTNDVKDAQLGNNIVGADWDAITFGDVKHVTDKFTKTVTGLKTEAEVYASKEIKTTLKGVDPDVVIKGEINADVIETAADGTKTWDVNTNAAKEKAQTVAYRMYRKSGEHVYTINPAEVKMLEQAGWINEGKAFTVNTVASGKGTPIYRLYNKNNGGMHFYTASAAEKDMLLANGWTEGKVVFYGADKATGIPVYRTYNTGSNNGEHNYTTNIAESEMNVQKGWRSEGVAFYVFK